MKRLLILAFACLMLFAVSCSKNPDEIVKLNDRISEFELKNQDLQQKIEELENENKELQETVDSLEKENQELKNTQKVQASASEEGMGSLIDDFTKKSNELIQVQSELQRVPRSGY